MKIPDITIKILQNICIHSSEYNLLFGNNKVSSSLIVYIFYLNYESDESRRIRTAQE